VTQCILYILTLYIYRFKENQTELIMSFFAMFYFSINVGSTISTFVTPIVRNNFGYAVAFSMPAALLVVATIVFILGWKFYYNRPPTGLRNNPLFQVINVTYSALKSYKRNDDARHWLDRAQVSCDKATIYDVKCVYRVAKVLIPLMVFW
jgi:hypothetical protein